MHQVTIDKYVPIPEAAARFANLRGCRESKWPFKNMVSGDSFTAPIRKRRGLELACRTYEALNNARFFIAVIDDENLRCWRLA